MQARMETSSKGGLASSRAVTIPVDLGMSELCSLETSNVRRTRDTGVKANTEEEETVNRTLRVAGVWRQHASTVQRSKLGNLWIPTSSRFPRSLGL